MSQSRTHRRKRPRKRPVTGVLPDDLYDYLPDESTSTPTSRGSDRRIVAGILPDDLYDYYTAEPEPRRSPALEPDARTWRVVDDWPEKVPITEAEIAVFEHWFADVLTELFGSPPEDEDLTGLSQSDNNNP